MRLTWYFIDYAIFAHPSFDANEYANAILSNQSYKPSSSGTAIESKPSLNEQANKEEISVALAKLSFGIDDVNRQLKSVINVHHEALLEQAAGVGQLETSVEHVQKGLKDISGSVTR